jgi:hypothetical protein
MVAVVLTEDVYEKIIEKQGQIYVNYKVIMELMKIANAAINRGMNGVEKELGLKVIV